MGNLGQMYLISGFLEALCTVFRARLELARFSI